MIMIMIQVFFCQKKIKKKKKLLEKFNKKLDFNFDSFENVFNKAKILMSKSFQNFQFKKPNKKISYQNPKYKYNSRHNYNDDDNKIDNNDSIFLEGKKKLKSNIDKLKVFNILYFY